MKSGKGYIWNPTDKEIIVPYVVVNNRLGNPIKDCDSFPCHIHLMPKQKIIEGDELITGNDGFYSMPSKGVCGCCLEPLPAILYGWSCRCASNNDTHHDGTPKYDQCGSYTMWCSGKSEAIPHFYDSFDNYDHPLTVKYWRCSECDGMVDEPPNAKEILMR